MFQFLLYLSIALSIARPAHAQAITAEKLSVHSVLNKWMIALAGSMDFRKVLLLILVFHRNHGLRRLLGRRRLGQARNLGDMKRAVGAVSPEQLKPIDRTHRQGFEHQLDQVAGIKEAVGKAERCDQREGQKNWQRIGL